MKRNLEIVEEVYWILYENMQLENAGLKYLSDSSKRVTVTPLFCPLFTSTFLGKNLVEHLMIDSIEYDNLINISKQYYTTSLSYCLQLSETLNALYFSLSV